MVTIRRLYVFLVCLVSLQAVTWAAIVLTQDLAVGSGGGSIAFTAFQIAVIVIGLPVFLVHWLWAQRSAGKDLDERGSALRRLYLYGMLAAFLGPLASSAFDLIATALGIGQPGNSYIQRRFGQIIAADLIAIFILGVLWFYHWWVTRADAQAAPETGNAATVHRLYLLGFCASGIWMVTLGIVNIAHWIMDQFGGAPIGGVYTFPLTEEVARLIVGLALWLPFWLTAQRRFRSADPDERESALRKFYLYVVVLAGSLGVVTNITFILAGLLRVLLGLVPQGDIRDPLSAIIGLGVLWAYHWFVLRGDAALAGEAPRQAGVRRLYLYLVAAVGLAAFLIGLSGDLSVLIRALSGLNVGNDLKEQLAWFTAALAAGLPVWLWPWWRAQAAAIAAGEPGAGERSSIVRKIYLYFYLLVATLTVLSAAVYIVYRLLSLVLGERAQGNLLADLGQAIAYSLIAVGVWLYHGYALRGDGRRSQREQTQRLAAMRVAVVDDGDGRFGGLVLEGLRRELPGLALDPIGLTPPAIEAMGGAPENLSQRLAEAALIVGPWNIALTGELAAAVAGSPARKLLAPVRLEGWEWAGVDRWNTDALARQAVRAVRQIVAGEEVKPARPLGAGAVIGIIVGVLFLLIVLSILVSFFLDRVF